MDFLQADTAEAYLHRTVFGLLKRAGAAGGAVCLTKSGGRTPFSFSRAYGYTNVDEALPVDVAETWFDCGGCTRLLTVMTTLHILEKHNVSLNSDINKLLPAAVQVHTHGWQPVTLLHLLTHTSRLVRGHTASTAAGAGQQQGAAPSSSPSQCPADPHDASRSPADPYSASRSPADPQQEAGPLVQPPLPPSARPSQLMPSLQGDALDRAHHHRPEENLTLEQRLMRPEGCRDSVVMYYLRRYEIGCEVPPGSAYRPSEVDVMLLAAVAEHLSGGIGYPQLARNLVLAPLGITLGHRHNVSCYSSGIGAWHPADSALAASQQLPEELSPLSGLVLTAQGAARLMGALVPAAAAAAGGGSGEAAQEQQQQQGTSVLSASMLQQMLKVHFVDPMQELPVGFLLTCQPHGHTSTCFSMSDTIAEDANPPYSLAKVPALHQPSSSSGLPPGCQAAFAVVPGSGVGICVLCNTSESGPPGSRFCHQVISSLLEAFRPLQQPAPAVRPWLLNVQPVRQDALLHLFCFPPAGVASSAMTDRWPANLPDYIRVRAVQLPGRGTRSSEGPLLRVAKISAHAANAIAAMTAADTPLALFGHGLGALCAFEAARRLEGWHSRRPLHLFVSGCASPDTWPSSEHPNSRYTPWSVDSDTARHLGLPPAFTLATKSTAARSSEDGEEDDEEEGGSGEGGEVMLPHAHELPADKLVGLLGSCLRTPRQLRKDPAALQEHLSLLRADVEAEETYTYHRPVVRAAGAAEEVLAALRPRSETELMLTSCHLSCPITVIRGEQDTTLLPAGDSTPSAASTHTPLAATAEVGRSHASPLLQGWAQMTRGPVQTIVLPGEHLYWEEERGRTALLSRMAQALGKQMSVHTSWLSVPKPARQPGGRPTASAAPSRRH